MPAVHMAVPGEEASTAGVGVILLTAAGVGDARTATPTGIGVQAIQASMDTGIRILGWDGMEEWDGTTTATRIRRKAIRPTFTLLPITQTRTIRTARLSRMKLIA